MSWQLKQLCVCLLAVILLSSQVPVAASWATPRRRALPDTPVITTAPVPPYNHLDQLHISQSASFGLVPSEFQTIFSAHDTLNSYDRKPECFRQVGAAIKKRCSDLNDDPAGKIRAAIALTKCELSTGNLRIPLECSALSLDGQGEEDQDVKLQQERCVEALSRSSQYWMSYSGYLREVPTLCFALKRWGEVDLAKELYRNATKEKIILLDLFVKKEQLAKERHLNRSREMEDYAEHLTVLLQQLNQASREQSANLSTTLREAASNELPKAYDKLGQALAEQARQQLSLEVQHYHTTLEVINRDFLQDFQSNLEPIQSDLTSLQRISDTTQSDFERHRSNLAQAYEESLTKIRSYHLIQQQSQRAMLNYTDAIALRLNRIDELGRAEEARWERQANRSIPFQGGVGLPWKLLSYLLGLDKDLDLALQFPSLMASPWIDLLARLGLAPAWPASLASLPVSISPVFFSAAAHTLVAFIVLASRLLWSALCLSASVLVLLSACSSRWLRPLIMSVYKRMTYMLGSSEDSSAVLLSKPQVAKEYPSQRVGSLQDPSVRHDLPSSAVKHTSQRLVVPKSPLDVSDGLQRGRRAVSAPP